MSRSHKPLGKPRPAPRLDLRLDDNRKAERSVGSRRRFPPATNPLHGFVVTIRGADGFCHLDARDAAVRADHLRRSTAKIFPGNDHVVDRHVGPRNESTFLAASAARDTSCHSFRAGLRIRIIGFSGSGVCRGRFRLCDRRRSRFDDGFRFRWRGRRRFFFRFGKFRHRVRRRRRQRFRLWRRFRRLYGFRLGSWGARIRIAQWRRLGLNPLEIIEIRADDGVLGMQVDSEHGADRKNSRSDGQENPERQLAADIKRDPRRWQPALIERWRGRWHVD